MNTKCPDGTTPQAWSHQASSALHVKQGAAMNAASLFLSRNRQMQHQSLAFTTKDDAQRAVLQVLARDKRRREEGLTVEEQGGEDFSTASSPSKKHRTQDPNQDEKEPSPVLASDEGIASFHDNDVLSGRGGGTNVHKGNRHFRDLINRSRRAYLKARKNDKPAISRAIVRSVRQRGGRFLKREEGSTLWFEIGDDAAREKTSQALRQRAPEMRKVLFETEMQQARQQVQELQKNQQRLLSRNFALGFPPQSQLLPNSSSNHLNVLNPFVPLPKVMAPNPPSSEMYAQLGQHMMTATLLSGGINRISPHGA